MKTLKDWQEGIWATGRIVQNATKAEAIEGMDIIADAMMSGKATLGHADALLGIRFALMSDGDKADEAKVLHDHLSKIGTVGGSASTPDKRAASAENGKKGGRPKGSKNNPRGGDV